MLESLSPAPGPCSSPGVPTSHPSFLKDAVCKYSLYFYMDSSWFAPRGRRARCHPCCHPVPPQIQPSLTSLAALEFPGILGRMGDTGTSGGDGECLTPRFLIHRESEVEFPLTNPLGFGHFSPKGFWGSGGDSIPFLWRGAGRLQGGFGVSPE